MSVQLPLFPLQLVAFPGEEVNLHIFEQRYRDLVRHTEEKGISFGIPTVIDGGLRPLGTEVGLVEVAKRYPGGESDIRTRGRRVFRIQRFHQEAWGNTYPGGEVEFVDVDLGEDPAVNREILDITRRIYQTLKIEKQVPPANPDFRTYDIAHYVGLTLEQEYELLSLFDAEDRQQFLLEHLRTVRPDVQQQSAMKARAKLNGHFRELHPPKF